VEVEEDEEEEDENGSEDGEDKDQQEDKEQQEVKGSLLFCRKCGFRTYSQRGVVAQCAQGDAHDFTSPEPRHMAQPVPWPLYSPAPPPSRMSQQALHPTAQTSQHRHPLTSVWPQLGTSGMFVSGPVRVYTQVEHTMYHVAQQLQSSGEQDHRGRLL
jgi:hypothetical protein